MERRVVEAGARPVNRSGDELFGVAAISVRSAWAVGEVRSHKALLLRWNGATWRRVASSDPASYAILSGVTATPARNAWAVGFIGNFQTLILRWNGIK